VSSYGDHSRRGALEIVGKIEVCTRGTRSDSDHSEGALEKRDTERVFPHRRLFSTSINVEFTGNRDQATIGRNDAPVKQVPTKTEERDREEEQKISAGEGRNEKEN